MSDDGFWSDAAVAGEPGDGDDASTHTDDEATERADGEGGLGPVDPPGIDAEEDADRCDDDATRGHTNPSGDDIGDTGDPLSDTDDFVHQVDEFDDPTDTSDTSDMADDGVDIADVDRGPWVNVFAEDLAEFNTDTVIDVSAVAAWWSQPPDADADPDFADIAELGTGEPRVVQ